MQLGPQNAGNAPSTAERKSAEIGLLAALVVGCLVPRAIMAWKLDALCNDAIFYIGLAENFERGNLEDGFGRLGLNTFPPVLAALHRAGFSWEGASKTWGVLMASLAVLPLYGWVRRQFDRRTALVAALLYAFHPKLVEWSPELLRDPTFWFLSALSLYASWRAAAEASLGWYLAAGVSIALAAHTRFEGWFFYLPLLFWSFFGNSRRFGAERWLAYRKRATGIALSAAISPLLVLLVNITVLGDQARWQLGNFDRLEYVALWCRAVWPGSRNPASDASDLRPLAVAGSNTTILPAYAQNAPPIAARMSIGKMVRRYANAFRRGFGGLFGLAWLIGFAFGRGRWLRADHGVLAALAACIGAAAWIHLWYGQATSSRYFLTIVLLACPCAATGWLRVYDRLSHQRPRLATMVLAFLVTLLVGVGELLADHHDGRSREAALGRWLLAELGKDRRIATVTPMPLIGFYARATTMIVPLHQALPAAWPEPPIDAIVATSRGAEVSAMAHFTALARERGFEPVDRRQLPSGHNYRDIVVLMPTSRGDLP
jgi:4-amino-4-deoxy-L-arabinose transferase-like glycosyltransferase